MKTTILSLLSFMLSFSLMAQGGFQSWISNEPVLSIQNLSGKWYNEEAGEEIMLSASEYFEMEGDYGSYYGIWGIEGQYLQFGFASTGNIASFQVIELAPGSHLQILITDAETGEETFADYTYLKAAPTYNRLDVAQVVQEFQTAQLMQIKMMETQHRINMSAINAIGGSRTIVRDQYGNIIDEY